MMIGTKEWKKQNGESSDIVKRRNDDAGLNPNPCGGCSACHQMTRIHAMPTSHAWTGDGGEGADIQKPCASNFFQRNMGNNYMQSVAKNSVPTLQKKCACGGSCASCAEKEDELGKIQTKLTIGPANDVYEQEADRVADKIMRMPDSLGQCEDNQSNVGINIQRIPASGDSLDTDSDIQLNLNDGQPLPSSTRQFMEPRFGMDFSHVRLHTDPEAHQTASQIQAKAFTYGHHIWLAKEESERDKNLMAHELTHVVQQGAVLNRDQSETNSNFNGASKIQRDVRPQCPSGVKTVTVDLVALRGSSRNPVDDLTFANSVFRPCCVQFTMGTGVSVEPTLSDTWLGGDTDLRREPSPSVASTEELDTFSGATTAFRLASRIRAFYMATISNPGARATSRPSVFATGTAAPIEGMVSVSNRGDRRSLAHEFGHILLNANGTVHTTHPGGTDNLMEPTNSATGETLEPTQCATIFANA